jgi:hypothetical protein
MESRTPGDQREGNIRTILAISTLRRVDWRIFFRFALDELSDEQLCVVIQRIGEWMNENPPKKGKDS